MFSVSSLISSQLYAKPLSRCKTDIMLFLLLEANYITDNKKKVAIVLYYY